MCPIMRDLFILRPEELETRSANSASDDAAVDRAVAPLAKMIERVVNNESPTFSEARRVSSSMRAC